MVFTLRDEMRLTEIQEKAARINNYFNRKQGNRASKVDKWAHVVRTIRLPSGETATIRNE